MSSMQTIILKPFLKQTHQHLRIKGSQLTGVIGIPSVHVKQKQTQLPNGMDEVVRH